MAIERAPPRGRLVSGGLGVVRQPAVAAAIADEPGPGRAVAGPAPTPAATRPPDTRPVLRRDRRAVARAVTGSLFTFGGVIAFALIFLTGSWVWFFIVPPVLYGARQLAKKW